MCSIPAAVAEAGCAAAAAAAAVETVAAAAAEAAADVGTADVAVEGPRACGDC